MIHRPTLITDLLTYRYVHILLITLLAGANSCGLRADDASAFGFDLGDGMVVVTTSIWADVVANAVCAPEGAVVPLIPPGTDPHGFQPTLAQADAVREASVVIANGGGLEEPLTDLLEDRRAAGDRVVYATDLTAVDSFDPHVWLDPTLVGQVVERLVEILVEAGADRAEVEQCATTYIDELEVLDRELAVLLADIPPSDRNLVTNHEALGHFADRYQLTVIGTILPSPSSLAEPNPRDLEDLAALIEEQNVRTVFTESGHSTEESEALASLLGDVDIIPLSIEALGEPGSGTDSYIGLMRTNGELVADSLGGRE